MSRIVSKASLLLACSSEDPLTTSSIAWEDIWKVGVARVGVVQVGVAQVGVARVGERAEVSFSTACLVV